MIKEAARQADRQHQREVSIPESTIKGTERVREITPGLMFQSLKDTIKRLQHPITPIRRGKFQSLKARLKGRVIVGQVVKVSVVSILQSTIKSARLVHVTQLRQVSFNPSKHD